MRQWIALAGCQVPDVANCRVPYGLLTGSQDLQEQRLRFLRGIGPQFLTQEFPTFPKHAERFGAVSHLRMQLHEVSVAGLPKAAVEAAVRSRVDDWQALLTRRTTHGRQLLREMLVGPIQFRPVGRAYRFEGEASFGRLLSGEAGLPTNVVPVRGSAPLRNFVAVALDFNGTVQLAA